MYRCSSNTVVIIAQRLWMINDQVRKHAREMDIERSVWVGYLENVNQRTKDIRQRTCQCTDGWVKVATAVKTFDRSDLDAIGIRGSIVLEHHMLNPFPLLVGMQVHSSITFTVTKSPKCSHTRTSTESMDRWMNQLP